MSKSFIAPDPSLRENYCKKMKELLMSGGKLVGVLFNIPLYSDHPPFGGSREEYEELFQKYFRIEKLEKCYNSIPPRWGNEVFIRLKKGV